MKKKLLVFAAFLIFLVFNFNNLLAQESGGVQLSNQPPEPEKTSAIVSPMTRLEFILSVTVLVFGLIITVFELFLIRNRKISSEDSVKFILITLIIISTLYLITAGYSNDQIAPAVGLLGTIAGYLLGRIQHPSSQEIKNEKPA